MKNKLKAIILIFIIIATIISLSRILNSISNNENGLEKDDFYMTVNKEIIANKELDADEEYWSIFLTETQDKVDDKVENIIKDIIKSKEKYNKKHLFQLRLVV